MNRERYISPYMERYGSNEMNYIFSDKYRHRIWRDLWYALAYSQAKLGAPIKAGQLVEIEKAVCADIDYDKVREYEAKTHHDVVAHLMEFSDHCPNARGVLHLGATSCYITDNADIIIMRNALNYTYETLEGIIGKMCIIADQSKDIPLVGRTHLQRAQLTTVGKRICMWIQDFMMDYEALADTYNNLRMLGFKGATGSQSSLYTLFDGDYNKAQELDRIICARYKAKRISISGQTYTRKMDSMVASTLSQIAQSASKMATDIRLMAAIGEMYEGFGKEQVGSSAMPYKRNPITCEKVCGIARHVIINSQNTAITASTQWLERTLDDSSNKRLTIAELFLGVSEILSSITKILNNLTINADVCIENAKEHAKMASLEDDIIKDVMNGGDRLEGHKRAIWSDGSDDASINTGFAEQQVASFLENVKWRLNK